MHYNPQLKDQTEIFKLQARVPSWATMFSCDAVQTKSSVRLSL